VLSRKPGEELLIGRDVRVIVQRVANGRVTIAIEAPDAVKILRGELQPHNPAAPPGPNERAA